ncbi:MAG: PLP-dependent aminotransferase family protein [Methanolinea sp.]|jgi:2-aminoadipate transaminase|nr:PLP-dependent aminotransferase family protein [Methanolinea sp.]
MIREILKVTERPDIISFAGGLPDPAFLDVAGVARAAGEVLGKDNCAALQYATSEGFLPLREWIAGRYRTRFGLSVDPGEILITNGSQQALDILGRIFIDEGDPVAIEAPGYLGAIQAFSQYLPVFHPVLLGPEGPDTSELSRIVSTEGPVFFYAIPNSQNPSGISYSTRRREEIASIISDSETVLIEDDAYGELQFTGDRRPSFSRLLPRDRVILLGSFSKIFSPGMRLGWLCAEREILDHAVTAKQASDLHSNILAQRILHRYLLCNDIDAHISRIKKTYAARCSLMLNLMDELFPGEVSYTRPDGGMFIWLTLPSPLSATELYRRALAENVAILPGTPFYTNGAGDRGVRLNFSNADEEKITEGMTRLARVVHAYIRECRKGQSRRRPEKEQK